jgi:hypothetical protein
VARDQKPGTHVVLKVKGKGDCPTSPVRVKGFHLVLVFEDAKAKSGSTPKGMVKPLVLVPQGATAVNQDALFDVQDGSLELRGAHIRFANSAFAKLPRYMFRAQGADLRLFRCRLDGPLTVTPEGYRGLVRLEGSGKADVEKTPGCVVSSSVLISSRDVVQVAGTGARLSLAGSLVVAADNAVWLDPGASATAPLTVQCLLEGNTVAVKGSAFQLGDAPRLATPAEPIIVQADNNLFLAPFTDAPRRATLLRFNFQALPRGLLLWQGKGNGYDDKRLHGYVSSGSATDAAQPLSVWLRLWGSRGEQNPRTRDLTKSRAYSFSLEKLQLERLALPLYLRPKRSEPPLGADLEALGIVKKK